jgi:hypothetical protein
MRTNGKGEARRLTARVLAGLVAEQSQSGLSVRVFCERRGVGGHSFYLWREQLREASPVRFALVECSGSDSRQNGCVELLLVSGDRLHIGPGVDAATLQTVLEVLGEPGMIHLPASVRVYLCTPVCDMRKRFDGLQALVTQAMELDPFAGHLFVLANRRRERVKIPYWDRDGFAVWSK